MNWSVLLKKLYESFINRKQYLEWRQLQGAQVLYLVEFLYFIFLFFQDIQKQSFAFLLVLMVLVWQVEVEIQQLDSGISILKHPCLHAKVDSNFLAYKLKGHSNWVLYVSWSPDGRRLASGGMDTTIRIWDPTTGRPPTNALTQYRKANWNSSPRP